jgi:hypothetical protein
MKTTTRACSAAKVRGRTRRFRLGAVAIGLMAVALAGCTGSGGASSGASTASSTGTTAASTATAAASGASGMAANQPGGQPPDAAGGGSQSGASSTSASATGATTITGTSQTLSGKTYTGSKADESAILVTGSGTLTASNVTVSKTGDTTSSDESSFYGLNAGILVQDGSTATVTDSTITTKAAGANGAFATGSGSSLTLKNVTINASGDGAHAVMATQGATVTLTNVNMNTTDAHSGAIATDRGGGTITATGGTVRTSGQDSPGIYSTGAITVTGATISASGAEAAVIEGGNTITLTDTSLSSSFAGKWGVIIYQSMSGDASGTKGTFTMTGGTLSLTGTGGPLFYVTNSTGVITLKGVDVSVASGVLVKAAAGNWGTSGSNGGTVVMTADGQTLSGDLAADSISAIDLTLSNRSSLTGAIDNANTAKSVALALDAGSTWTVTADSYLTSLSDPSGISGTTITNIVGNGHTVYYDASSSANSDLGGKTYTLAGGGTLKPA